MTAPIEVQRIDHVGIRVSDEARSCAFYARFGFEVTYRQEKPHVVILRNAHGIEINLIVNGDPALDGTNVLVDGDAKRAAGYTHMALAIDSIEDTLSRLAAAGVAVSDGPKRLGDGTSLFVRDPDRNVIELRARS